jgi:hypothetical protein
VVPLPILNQTVRKPAKVSILAEKLVWLREAEILVTANFRDFLSNDTEVLEAERVALYHHPKGKLLIAHPYRMADWFKAGQILLPTGELFDF